MRHELAFWRAGMCRVAGIDEVGRGPLAGPLVAAAVVLPAFVDDRLLRGVRDSKTLSRALRSRLALQIRAVALSVGLGSVSPEEIDRWGLTAANRAAMKRALAALGCEVDALILDAVVLPDVALPQVGLIRGDARCLSVAGASIVAKVERDRLMDTLADQYPHYGFERHHGYGTAMHLAALGAHGPSPVHRRSFAPVGKGAAP